MGGDYDNIGRDSIKWAVFRLHERNFGQKWQGVDNNGHRFDTIE